MTKAFTKVRWVIAVLTLMTVTSTCSTTRRDDVVSMRKNLSTGNGLGQNGLTTNGMWNNGMWNNGMWNNGMWNNGMWNNGMWNNGMWNNGMWNNGMWNNGMWNNGMWNNGMWNNGLTGTDAVPGQVLRNSSYARQLLQYIYSCAMPATTYDTTLDPNQAAPLLCTSDADCDVGYACSGNKCVIPLQGGGANGSGLGVNGDETTWWGSGKCDETCQRWVSACVLARTNAYGVHVQISMRAPSDAPQGVKDALAVGTDERSNYTLREGAYYGNIFATTPADPPPADPNYVGPATGAIVSTPVYVACAGPGSNIPQITKRFCSSQGDQVVIKVPGICLTNAMEVGVCAGEDTNPASQTYGAIRDCYTSTTAPTTLYQEVLTVFLQQPIAVCGNAVCEAGEDATCASDCHPGTWTKNYDPTFETLQTGTPPINDTVMANFTQFAMSAVAPDDTVVVLGDTPQFVDLDGVFLPSSGGAGVLVKYNPDGSYTWPGRGIRFSNGVSAPPSTVNATGIAVAPNGTITVVGSTNFTLWWTTFTSAGTQLATHTLSLGAGVTSLNAFRTVSVDSQGNTLVAAYFQGTATFPTSPTPTVLTGTFTNGINNFLMKVSSQGTVLWARALSGEVFMGSLVNDLRDNIIVTGWQSTSTGGPTLVKLCAQDPDATQCADGTIAWSKTFGGLGAFATATADPFGSVYASGIFGTNVDFGGGPRPTTGSPPFLVKYSPNGVYQWDAHATVVCAPSGCNFGSYTWGTNIGFDPAGNVVLASWGSPSIGGGIDFGFGIFPTYASTNVFLAAYQPQAPGALKWAKQIPGVAGIDVRGVGVDSQGRTIVSGAYGGSMVVDDVMLVTGLPEEPSVVHPFIASFGGPPPSDVTPPVIGTTVDQGGASINTVPLNIYVPATSPAGTNVFFMPPTAIDSGNAGTSVVCLPPPNTTFPIGTTKVTCTASDPRGNHRSATFNVTVADTVGPIFSPVSDITIHAPNGSGATLSYVAPTAKDQLSGAAVVTCTPPSGTLLTVGDHTVTCTARDASTNLSQVTFAVHVTQAGFGAPCSATTDCPAGTCVDGVCCNTAATSCGQCQACNTAGAVGTCAPVSGGNCDDGDACTQHDTCQAGTCTPGTPVSCGATDQCHAAGTCNPATGACSNPAAPNGTACSDGNACTQSDTCQAGTCTGANPVTCAPSDSCHLAGTCNPSTGLCSNPAAPNGTACSDGNACTQSDACLAGVCAGANPVTCAPSDPCHLGGTCDPSTGTCSNPTAPDGTACSDGNACTAADVCTAGACVGGSGVSCDDQNPCTVDSCDPLGGCVHTSGNAGAICRAAGNACDSAEVCTGSSATCPVNADKLAPALAPGTNQTVVGNCSASPVGFAVPSLTSASCEGGTNVTCTWNSAGSQGTCAKSGSGASVPGNRYGAFTITCTAKDAGGNVSVPVVFTVTVLQPLTVRIQPPLSGDNDTIDNIVKLGSTVPTKVLIYACGTNVTKTASVIAKLGTTYVSSGGSTTTRTLAAGNDAPDTGGVMTLDGTYYRYNLSTKGLSVTAGIPASYQENITVAYKSAPSIVVGSDAIQLDTK